MRLFARLILLLTLCAALAAIPAAVMAKEAPKVIKVVGVLSVTGKMASQVVQMAETYKVYFDKVNQDGGVFVKEYGKKIPIELRVLDDESNGLKSQAQLEVGNSWGAVANVGGLGCASFELGTPIAMKNKMTWIGPGCGGWTPHQHGNDWMYSTFIKTVNFAPMTFDLLDTVPEKDRPRKVAIFEINQLDCAEAAEAWHKRAKEGGYEIVVHEKYPAGTKDFSAMITKAKAAGAEVLLAYPIPPAGPLLVKQMKELDWAPKVTCLQRAPEGSAFGPALGELSDYVIFPVAWSKDFKLPGNDYLLKQLKAKYNRIPDPVAGPAYAAAQVLVDAIERAGTLDRAAIRKAVAETDMETVAGRIKFAKNGHALEKATVILQWMNGDTHIVYANEAAKKYGDLIPVKPFKLQPAWSER
jgi:branched-chain amino acid transport system substrate-binding protein